jgi:exodeoxyribonuclease-3
MLRVATVNVNGVRAAFRNGMREWLAGRDVDILAMQEVRASTDDLQGLLGEQWDILHDAATAKGRAGVAIASRRKASIHRVELGDAAFDTAGRWLEADYEVGDRIVTVVSTYVHSGNVGTPRQREKYKFLDAMTKRIPQLTEHTDLALVVGDLNVGHRELDIRNWRGNRTQAGFLPKERSYFDRFVGPAGKKVLCADGVKRIGLGWVDVGRTWSGEVDGPYTWWANRGKAFDNDTGWRIDYQMASPALAATARSYAVDRAPAWDQRWSDHAAVVVDYAL